MYLLVDPIVLCLPEGTATSEEIDVFVEHLMIWNEVVRDHPDDDQFCMTEECYDALVQANRYPYRELMNDLIDNRRDLPHIDGKSAYRACQQIIEGACWPSFEKIADLPLGEFVTDKVELDPDLVKRIPREIEKSFRETFGYIAYAKEIRKSIIASDLLLLTHPIKEDKIAIDITLLVGSDDLHSVKVETDLPIAETPQDLARLKGLTQIWDKTEQAIALVKSKAGIGPGEKLSPYTVGPEFNDSLGACQFPKHSSRLDRCFEKIAQLLAGKSMLDDYPLRTGAGPNDPQREQTVGKITWKARRLRITSGSGPVYRLHYWTTGNKYIFSNVVSKNDDITICAINEKIVAQIE